LTDAFEEVEDSLRQEKASRVWKRAAPFVIGGVAAIIIGVAAFEFWNVSRRGAIEEQAIGFSAAAKALNAGDLAVAKTQLVELAKGDGGFAEISNHLLAGIEKDLGGDPAAIAQHLTAAAGEEEGLLADLATLKLAYLKADDVDLAELTAIVSPLTETDGPLAALSRELLAAKAFATGDIERARRDYQALTLALDAPREMQRRVQQTLMVLPKAASPAPASTSTTLSGAPAASPPTPQPAAPADQNEQTGTTNQ